MSQANEPSNRLERALAAFLEKRPSTRMDEDALLHDHPDLADLLEPMLAREQAAAQDGDAAGTADEPRVLGDYRLVREIGRGGMGVVYEAWQRSVDRRVAVKLLGAAHVASPAAVARFRREAAAAARVQHPNIVEVYGFGSEGGENFFAMQFVDGKPLHDVAERFRQPTAAVRLCLQIVDALRAAHAAGLVHRDVKPGNVLVRDDGTAMLTDFGIARDDHLPTLTREGHFLGTLAYASPEQLRGEAVDAGADIWALGVMLYELLTGTLPFDAPTHEGMMHRILAEEPKLRDLAGIGDDLAAVLDKMLRKPRNQRYGSATALLADLQAIERGEPVSVRLPTRIERLHRWARREPWRAAVAVVLMLGIPALSAALGYLWANAPRIAAATAAEQRAAREELLSSALLFLVDGDPRRGLELLQPLGDGDDEVAILRALLHCRVDDVAAATRSLAGRDGAAVSMVRQFLERPQMSVPPLDGNAKDAFDYFVRSHVLHESSTHRGRRSREALQQMLSMARTATLLAPTPRLNYLANLVIAADLADDRNTLREAARAIDRHFPDSDIGLLLRSRSLARHEPAVALQLLDRYEAKIGSNARSLSTRGLALEAQNRLEDAVAANRAALAANDDSFNTWYNLGACLRKAKDLPGAVQALRTSIERNGNYAPTWNTLGLALRDQGELADAVAAFTRSIEIAPGYASAAINLGNLHVRRGELADAEKAFRTAIAAEPDNVRSLANLGDVLARQGRDDEALEYSLRAAELAPGDLIPNHNTAQLALQLGLPRLALPFARRALDAGKQDARTLLLWAQALVAQPTIDGEAALAAARAADAACQGNDVKARIALAQALHATGDTAAASKVLEDAKADPRFAAAKQQDLLEAASEHLRDR